MTAMKNMYASMIMMGSKEQAQQIQKSLEAISFLERAAKAGPPKQEDFPKYLQEQFISPSG